MNEQTIESAPLAVRESLSSVPVPMVTPEEARDLMRRYIELCEAVLTPDDYQEFEQWDPIRKCRVKKRFKKKSAVKKLQTFFSVAVEVKATELHQLADGHFAWSVTATARTPGGRPVEATGACSTMEERFELVRYDNETDEKYQARVKKANARAFHDVLSTAETRATNRAVMNCIGVGGGEVTADEVQRDRESSRPAQKPEGPPAAQDGPKTTLCQPPSPASTQTATFVPSWDSLRARWAAATGFDPGEFKATLGGLNRSEVLATVEALEAQKAAAPAPAQAQPAISAERIRLHAYAKTISDERYRAIMSLEYGVESSSQLHDGHVRPLADLLASLCSDAVRERVEADLAAGLEAWKQRQSPPPAADNDDEPNFDFAIGAGA